MTTKKCYSTDNEVFNDDGLGDLICKMDDPQVGLATTISSRNRMMRIKNL